MALSLRNPGGIVPRLDAETLPDMGAQIAENVDTRGGVWAPINETDPFYQMHDGTLLKAGLPASEIAPITKPASAPTRELLTSSGILGPLGAAEMIARPQSWGLIVKMFGFAVSVNMSTGSRSNDRDVTLEWSSLRYTDIGFDVRGTVSENAALTLNNLTYENAVYAIKGPAYYIEMPADIHGNGGPKQAIQQPVVLDDMTHESPARPEFTVPLYYNGFIYGYLSLRDIVGPDWNQTGVSYATQTAYNLPVKEVMFHFDLNYVRPSIDYLRFLYTNKAPPPDNDREGPPSPVSDLMRVMPGERLIIRLPSLSDYGGWLYSSIQGSDKYFRRAEMATGAPLWTDTGLGAQAIELPPFGNFTDSGEASDSVFREGSFIHPARYAVFFGKSPGSEKRSVLYRSDTDRYHAIPGENTDDFREGATDDQTEIIAIALVGGTTLVFTRSGTDPILGKVYAVSGDNPEYLSKQCISHNTPLLDKRSICRLGSLVYFVTHDGLAVTNGASVQIVRGDIYTSEWWKEQSPETFMAKTSGQSIFLERADEAEGDQYRFDLDENGIKALTTFTATDGAGWTWKSKRFVSDREMIYDFARVDADAAVTLQIFLDGSATAAHSYPITPNKLQSLVHADNVHARRLEVKAESNGTARAIDLFERKVIGVEGGVMRFTPENVELWENLWIKFPNRDRPVAGCISAQNAGGAGTGGGEPVVAVLELYDRIGTRLTNEATPINLSGGGFFSFPRDLPFKDYWRILVRKFAEAATEPFTATKIDELTLATRIPKQASGMVHVVAGGGIPEWLYTRWEGEGTFRIKSMRVLTYDNTYTNLRCRVYLDGAVNHITGGSFEETISDRKEIRKVTTGAPLNLCSSFEFQFVNNAGAAQDHRIAEVFFYYERIDTIGEGGLSITGANGWRRNLARLPVGGKLAGVLLNAAHGATGAIALYNETAGYSSAAASHAFSATTPTTMLKNFFPLARSVVGGALWEFDVDSDSAVYGLEAIPRQRVQVGAVVHLVGRDSAGIAEWLRTILEVPDRTIPKSLIVHASATVYLEAYFDGAELNGILNDMGVPTRLAIANGDEIRLAWARCGSVEFAFFAAPSGDVRADHLVTEMFMFSAAMRDVSGPVEILGPPWQVGLFKFPDRGKFAAFSIGFAEITASQSPAPTATLFFRIDGAPPYEITVSDGNLHWLPRSMAEGSVVEVGASSTGQLFKILLLPLERVPVGGKSLMLKANDTGVMPWAAAELDFTENTELVSGIVKADIPVWMRIYKNGSAASLAPIEVADGAEFRIDGFGQASSIALRFFSNSDATLGADDRVNEVMLFHREVREIPNEGIVIRDWADKPNRRRLFFQFKVAGALASMRIVLTDYTGAEAKLYVDGVLAQTVNPTNRAQFKLAADFPVGGLLEIDTAMADGADMLELHLFGRMVVEVDYGKNGKLGGLLSISRQDNPASYLGLHVLGKEPVAFSCGQVWAEVGAFPVTIRLYDRDGLLTTEEAQDTEAFRMEYYDPAREFLMDVVGADGKIIHKVALATSMGRLKA